MLVCKNKLWLWRQKGNLEIQNLQRYTYNVCIYNIDMGWLNIDMGWLRLVGSSKSQVSFAEYSLFYRALLQKRPIVWSIKKYAWACDVCQQIQMCTDTWFCTKNSWHQKAISCAAPENMYISMHSMWEMYLRMRKYMISHKKKKLWLQKAISKRSAWKFVHACATCFNCVYTSRDLS